jgi:hypothetical protein
MADRLPEALVSRFAVALRDVLWFRDRVERFLQRAGVPPAIMRDVRASRSDATIKKAQRVIDLLEQSGASGATVIQSLFTQLADWSDLSHLDGEKRKLALRSQHALKEEIKAYADRRRYVEQKELEQHQEREARGRPRPLDHARLQQFRERFDTAFQMTDAQARGNVLESLLNEVFDYYCPDNRGPFRRTGEQVDGHFRYDGHEYLCEIRWRAEQAIAADVSVLRDRATAGFGGDVRALFVSFNGFTPECLESLKARAGQERVILMDGVDLRAVLNSDLAFDVLLSEKLAWAVRQQRAFVPVREIVQARIDGRPAP